MLHRRHTKEMQRKPRRDMIHRGQKKGRRGNERNRRRRKETKRPENGKSKRKTRSANRWIVAALAQLNDSCECCAYVPQEAGKPTAEEGDKREGEPAEAGKRAAEKAEHKGMEDSREQQV